MRKPVVIANWKMNGNLALYQDLSALLVQEKIDFTSVDVIICPPYLNLQTCSEDVKKRQLSYYIGAQNMSQYDNGAFTGEVSAQMLSEMFIDYVIIGHSERRQNFHETDDVVVAKCKKAFDCGMVPIYCVGETFEEREQGLAFDIILKQLRVILDGNVDIFQRGIIAYEPIWAIGTGLNASAEEAEKMHQFIRSLVREYSLEIAEKVRILYGGSVNPDNINALVNQENIDGCLLGGMSLIPEKFISICKKILKMEV